MLIAIEGIDASGKQTVAEGLSEHLAERGHDVSNFAFPDYTTDTGAIIQQLLTGVMRVPDASQLEMGYILQALYNADRAAHVTKLRALAASNLSIGVCDRYWMSGLVYGTVFHGMDENWLIETNSLLPQPELWLLIDIPVEESVRRRRVRDDSYEANIDMLKRIRQHYVAYFRRFDQAQRDVARLTSENVTSRFVIVDGMQSKDDVLHDCTEAVASTLNIL